MKRRTAFGIGLALALLLMGARPVGAGTPGVTDEAILLGTSAATKGHAAFLGQNIVKGIRSYFEAVNKAGGVHGRKLMHIDYDDDYNPPLMISNTRHLIKEDEVFALIGYVGTPTTLAVVNRIHEAKVPLVGPFTGAQELREPFRPYIINVRASYRQETRQWVDRLVKGLGVTRVAAFYQDDAYGRNGRDGTQRRLLRYDLSLVGEATYKRGAKDMREQVRTLRAADPQVVTMTGVYQACAAFILEARRQGWNPLFVNISFVGPSELARLLGPRGEGVINSTVVPSPTYEELPLIRQFQRHMRESFPGSPLTFVALEGYVDAVVMVEGLRRAGPELTQEGFLEAIRSISNWDIGIGSPITFGEADHQGLDLVEFAIIRDGRFVHMTEQDWTALRSELTKEGLLSQRRPK